MKTKLTLMIVSLACSAVVHAGNVKFEAVVAMDEYGDPVTSFSTEVPQVMAFFHSTGTKQGDKIRGVWIAEDIGENVPKNSKIVESTVTADQADASGGFKLSKPAKGWPVGKYKIDIYDGNELETTVEFTVGSK